MTDDTMMASTFTFGVYPGGITGSPDGLVIGPPDDPDRIKAALDTLQGDARAFYVRGYLPFQDGSDLGTDVRETPERIERYLGPGRLLDLVLQYQSSSGDVDGWVEFVRRAVRTYGQYPGKLQVTEEPNLPKAPLDGA